jgi:hypothetical protein
MNSTQNHYLAGWSDSGIMQQPGNGALPSRVKRIGMIA